MIVTLKIIYLLIQLLLVLMNVDMLANKDDNVDLNDLRCFLFFKDDFCFEVTILNIICVLKEYLYR